MIVLTYSTGFVILDKELKPMVMLASSAGSLVLKKSEAAGDGGFLCYFLRSGRVKSRWWLNSSVGVAFSDGHSAPLLVSPSLCFLSSCSLPLPLSSLHSLLFLLSRCLLPFLPFCPVLSSCFLFFSSLVPPPLQCSTSSGFYSQRMQAFSLFCCRDGVKAGVHHGSRETCPLD